MEERVHLICPNCHTALSFNYVEGYEHKNIRCPKCQFTAKGNMYIQNNKAVRQQSAMEQEGDTPIYDPDKKELYKPIRNTPQKTVTSANSTAKLVVAATNESYTLKQGVNVVGRHSNESTADFKITSIRDMTMSRRNAEIIVTQDLDGNTKYYLADIKAVNPIKLNGETVKPLSKTELHINDRITLGSTDIILQQ